MSIKIRQKKTANTFENPITLLEDKDISPWAKSSTKPSYTLDEIAEGNDRFLDAIIEITYNDLKYLRDSHKLISGKFYRIIDYVTTVGDRDKDFSSANHQFDLIVQAISNKQLNENAIACRHKDDEYFKYNDLAKWEIKYTIDNDNHKYEWADWKTGKGVIYYMKDEFNNECYYDFKNILFQNQYTFNIGMGGAYGEYSYEYSNDNNNTIITDEYSSEESNEETSVTSEDTSLNKNFNVHDNKINPGISMGESTIKRLLGNLFNGENIYNNTLGYNCIENIFNNDCYNNILIQECKYNTFTQSWGNIIFENKNNTFKKSHLNILHDSGFNKFVESNNNTLYKSSNNIFKWASTNNLQKCSGNSFETGSNNILYYSNSNQIFSSECNTFKHSHSNILKEYSSHNEFYKTDSCHLNQSGNNNIKNGYSIELYNCNMSTFKPNCKYIQIHMAGGCSYFTFDPGIMYLLVDASGYQNFRAMHFHYGIQGPSAQNRKEITLTKDNTDFYSNKPTEVILDA